MSAGPTHWLADCLRQLQELGERHVRAKGLYAAGAADARAADSARRDYLTALAEMVEQVQRRPGVSACFVCHDGLLVTQAGTDHSFEALAAIAQRCLEAANQATKEIGEIRQMVLAGDDGKLALFCLGPIVVGIRGALDANLAQSLRS